MIEAEARRVVRYVAGLFVKGVPESTMAPVLRELTAERPKLYVKSHPKGMEEGVSLVEVVVHSEGQDPEEVRKEVESAIGVLEGRLRAFQPVELRRLSMLLRGYGAHRRGELVSMRGEKGWVKVFRFSSGVLTS